MSPLPRRQNRCNALSSRLRKAEISKALSIVDAIARRYYGELRLAPRRVLGMEARLRFPADRSESGEVEELPSKRIGPPSAGTD